MPSARGQMNGSQALTEWRAHWKPSRKRKNLTWTLKSRQDKSYQRFQVWRPRPGEEICWDAWGVILGCLWHCPPNRVKSSEKRTTRQIIIETPTRCLSVWFQLSFFLNSIKTESRWHTNYLLFVCIPQRLVKEKHSLRVNFSICNRRKMYLLIPTNPRFNRINQWRREMNLVICNMSVRIN